MTENRFEILLDELLSGKIPPADAAAFVAYVDEPQGRSALEALLTQRFDNDEYEVMPGLIRQARAKALLMKRLDGEAKSWRGGEEAGVGSGIESGAVRVMEEGPGDGGDGRGELEKRDAGLAGTGAVRVMEEEPGETKRMDVVGVAARRKLQPMKRWAAAAAVLLILAGGGWWWSAHRGGNKEVKGAVAENRFVNEVQPGSDKAILQLADGSHINLTDGVDGKLAEQGSAHVIRKNGELFYESGKTAGKGGAGENSGNVYYNIVSTPVAGKYHIVLADGTQVWLDALSSIRYPTVFPSGAREVEITGQAYLEVAKRPAQPFRVKAGNGRNGHNELVEVLGTSFNVNAYADEPSLRTTLVEGAVKVVSGSESLLLKPGEQGQLDDKTGLKLVTDADLVMTLAWKNGLFTYNGASIEKIMREVARWYGVEVVYADRINEQFVADIPRDVPLTKLLTLLSGTRQVHFSVENKKVTVMR